MPLVLGERYGLNVAPTARRCFRGGPADENAGGRHGSAKRGCGCGWRYDRPRTITCPPYTRRAERRDEEIREDLHVSSEGDMAAHARAQREIGEADLTTAESPTGPHTCWHAPTRVCQIYGRPQIGRRHRNLAYTGGMIRLTPRSAPAAHSYHITHHHPRRAEGATLSRPCAPSSPVPRVPLSTSRRTARRWDEDDPGRPPMR